MWDAGKAAVRGKCIALIVFIRKKSQLSDLS
jgi:hypothetical protein